MTLLTLKSFFVEVRNTNVTAGTALIIFAINKSNPNKSVKIINTKKSISQPMPEIIKKDNPCFNILCNKYLPCFHYKFLKSTASKDKFHLTTTLKSTRAY